MHYLSVASILILKDQTQSFPSIISEQTLSISETDSNSKLMALRGTNLIRCIITNKIIQQF